MQHIKFDYSGLILLVLLGLFVRTEIVEVCRIFERFKFSNCINVELKMGTSRTHVNKKIPRNTSSGTPLSQYKAGSLWPPGR
jgi:hypothetical protein